MKTGQQGAFDNRGTVEPPQLLRVLGLWQNTAIVVGIMIGTAIFIVPAEITREVGSRSSALAVWASAGLLSLFGALTFAELAAMLPQAGGQYVYLREAYGPLVSFLCGWTHFLSVQSGGDATLAVGFARYLGDFLPLTPWQQKAAAVAVIVVLTAINTVGVREGGWVQSVLTGVNVGAIVALIALGYALVHGSPGGVASLPAPSGLGFLSSFGVAMIAALWAYEGWNNVTFSAGEASQPGRNLPFALILGTSAVIALYLGLNAVYYHVLTLPEIAQSPRVAADAAVRILGRRSSHLVAFGIIISTCGSLNGSILTAPRVYYAMAKDGLFFRWCAAVHPRFHTPHLALVVQALWTILLVGLGQYEQLFTYTIFAAWVFYALTAFAVISLRRTQPDLPRPYRVFGYPFTPIIFVVASAWFIVNTLLTKPLEAGIGCLIVAVGVPVYLFWRRAPGT